MPPLFVFPLATDRRDAEGAAASRAVALAAADLLATAGLAAARYIHLPGPEGPAGPLPAPFSLERALGGNVAALGEGHALAGELLGARSALLLRFRLHALPGGAVVAEGELPAPDGGYAALPGRLARAAAEALRGECLPAEQGLALERPFTASEKAMMRFLEGASLATAAGRDDTTRREAARLLREALALDPEFRRAAEVLHAVGLFFMKSGRRDDALDAFNALVKARPDDARALAAVAECWIRDGKHARAVKPLRRAVELDPADDNLLLKLGWLGETTGDVTLAKECYLAARERGLEPERVLEKLATVHLAAGDHEAAARFAAEGRAAHPGNGLFPYILALARFKAGLKDEALETAREGERACPGYWGLPHLLETLHRERGEEALAEAARKRARDLNPDLDRDPKDIEAYQAGHEDIQAGRMEAGLEKLRGVVARDPRFWEAHLYLGVGLRHLGRAVEALPHFERVIAIKPDQAEAHNEIAVHCLETGDHDRALKHAAEACRLKPGHPGFLCNHGLARLYLGEPDAAEKLFMAAKWADPRNEVADNCLALLHELRKEGKAPAEGGAVAKP